MEVKFYDRYGIEVLSLPAREIGERIEVLYESSYVSPEAVLWYDILNMSKDTVHPGDFVPDRAGYEVVE